jgi:hypothetical protein
LTFPPRRVTIAAPHRQKEADLSTHEAFRAFSRSRPDLAAALRQFGISERSWQRMYSGARPVPTRLLPQFALIAWDDGLHDIAQALWDGGMPDPFRAELNARGLPTVLRADTVERLRHSLAEHAALDRDRIATMAGL